MTAVTPVWSLNGPTALCRCKVTGKAKPFFFCLKCLKYLITWQQLHLTKQRAATLLSGYPVKTNTSLQNWRCQSLTAKCFRWHMPALHSPYSPVPLSFPSGRRCSASYGSCIPCIYARKEGSDNGRKSTLYR